MQSGLYSPDIPLVSSELDVSSTGDKYSWAVPFKCRVVRFGVATRNDVGATGITLLEKRVADTDTTIATLNWTTAHTAGKFVYVDLATSVELSEGDILNVNQSDACAAGDLFQAVVIIRQVPEALGNNSKAVATA